MYRCIQVFLLFFIASCQHSHSDSDLVEDLDVDIYFVSYGDEKFKKSRKRIEEEAKDTNLFTEVLIYTPENLEVFSSLHSKFREENKRGGGYWLWKPYAIQKTLKKIEENSILVYMDAGSSINSEGINNVKKIMKKMLNSSFDAYVFQLQCSKCTDTCYTKMDTAIALGYAKDSKELSDQQIHATYFILKKTESAEKLIADWIKYATAENYRYLTDLPSKKSNHECFIDHRHDQSIFSLLNKRRENTKIVTDDGASFFKSTRIKE